MSAAAFADYFGTPRRESEVLNYLYSVSNKTTPRSPLAISQAVGVTPKSVTTIISTLRKVMDAEAIDTTSSHRKGPFYILTEVGRLECVKAREEYRKALAQRVGA